MSLTKTLNEASASTSHHLSKAPAASPLPCNQSTLADLKVGQSAHLVQVLSQGEMGERLMELGFIPGTLLKVVRKGPSGDPIQLLLRNYMLSIRREQASSVTVATESLVAGSTATCE